MWILLTVITKGFSLLLDANWWTNSQAGISPRRAGGGAYHAIIGTLLMALITAIIAVPIAVFTAIYLVEYGRGRLARAVSFMVDILTGIPSIVAALFIYAVWIGVLKQQRVGFSVSLALVLLMIPVVTRSTEEMLKLVPNELREASYALGVPKWKTIARIVLPTALSGIITGVLLGLARVMGETAPLIILAPYTAFINFNLFSGNIAALPTLIYTNFGSNIPGPERPHVGRSAHPDHRRAPPEHRRARRRPVQRRASLTAPPLPAHSRRRTSRWHSASTSRTSTSTTAASRPSRTSRWRSSRGP